MNALVSPLVPAWPAWPDYALIEDLLPPLHDFMRAGRVAMATLVRVQGPSPRPLYSEMLIAADGRVAGYVSGGCVEAAVAAEAASVLADGHPRLLDYGVGSPVLDIQLSCGGRIGIFVREMHDPAIYAATLAKARRERRTVSLLTKRTTGAWRAVEGLVDEDADHYVKLHRPPLRLVAVGGDPVTLAVARLAPMVGVEMVLLRPHGPEEPPADLTLVSYDPRSLAASLPDLVLDDRTAVYSLSHDADVDHAVASHALHSSAFVVGVLGSRNKIGARTDRLKSDGIVDEALDRLHLPAGLPIGAQTPHGIALSILAQVCQRDRARQP